MATARTVGPWTIFALAALAQFMVGLDGSIMNVALPNVQSSLHVAEGDLAWVINIYVLMFGGFLLLGGRAGDLFGRKQMYMLGMVLFAFGCLVGGFAQNFGWLIVARAVQGLGAAIIAPVALAIVTSVFPEGVERNRALGIYGALAGISGALGVLLGGILTSGLSWRWVLFVLVPFGVLAAVLSPSILPESRVQGQDRHFDVAGAVSISAGLLLLVYGVLKAPTNGWTSGTSLALFVVAIALIVAFVVIEARAPYPLLRLGIFRNQTLSMANAVAVLAGGSLFSMFFFISLYLQLVLRFSALKTGVAYLPLAVAIIVGSGIASGLLNRTGFRPVLIVGMAVTALGLLLFARVPVDGTYLADVLPAEIAVGVGLGFALVTLNIAAESQVKASELGLASGLINTSLQVGGALGLAVLASVATSRTNDVMATSKGALAALPGALTDGFHYAFAGGAVISGIGFVIALVYTLAARGRGQSATSSAAYA